MLTPGRLARFERDGYMVFEDVPAPADLAGRWSRNATHPVCA